MIPTQSSISSPRLSPKPPPSPEYKYPEPTGTPPADDWDDDETALKKTMTTTSYGVPEELSEDENFDSLKAASSRMNKTWSGPKR